MNVPCVLICVGGVLLGEMAVVAVVIMFSHECSDRIELLNDCRFEFGITENVHVIGPLVKLMLTADCLYVVCGKHSAAETLVQLA